MASKIKYEDVKNDIEKSGWQLISTTYVNLKSDLELECPEGHKSFIPYEKWRRGHYVCPVCKQNKFYNINESVIQQNGFRILALDQATITSGWSIYDDGKLIKFGAHTSEGSKNTERIANTKYWFASMIAKWHPDLVILEDIQLQTYKKELDSKEYEEAVIVFKKLAHLQGVLKNYLYETGIPYKTVAPATWRHATNIKGNKRTDQKKNAQLKIKKLYDIQVSQDIADAILIGRWGVEDNKKNTIIEF